MIRWDEFARDVVGKQLAKAVDSIGANIAECYGRFHFGEKLQFLYFARGSLFESKYWLNRARTRELLALNDCQKYSDDLTALARQLNAFADGLKSIRAGTSAKALRELTTEYMTDVSEDLPTDALFTETELVWLAS